MQKWNNNYDQRYNTIEYHGTKKLRDSLARRFNKYSTTDFLVKISDNNGNSFSLDESAFVKSIKPRESDIDFIYHFPQNYSDVTGKHRDAIQRLIEKGINGEIYTKKSPLNASQQGFSILSHGKLAGEQSTNQFQERANDRFYSYSVGYFNIDFLDDDLSKDYISTDRQSIRWDADDTLIELRNDLNSLISLTQQKWRKDWKTAKKNQNRILTRNNITVKELIESCSLSAFDKEGLDSLVNTISDLPNENKNSVITSYMKQTRSFVEAHNVYNNLIPKDVPSLTHVPRKIEKILEEMHRAAHVKDQRYFIITQGLLLRALIESITTSTLHMYKEDIDKQMIDSLHDRDKNKIEISKRINETNIDSLSFNGKYVTMIRLLSKKEKIPSAHVDVYIAQFQEKRSTKKLNILMHDSENYPDYDDLHTIWQDVWPKLKLGLILLDKKI